MRIFFITIVLTILVTGIVFVFWYQEAQYLLPTPIPKDYRAVAPDDVIQFDTVFVTQHHSKPKILHFFNPDCPCSRFNKKHFINLKDQFGSRVDFYAVVNSFEKVEAAKKLLENDIAILVDTNGRLANACGVYSTPQAVLVQTNDKLYFRGNYNRARYCTDVNSNFVQMALDSLIAGKKPPRFSELATRSYGCRINEGESF